MMPQRRYLANGQKVSPGKVDRARQLRRESTPEETLLWNALRNNALGVRFRRQQIIDGFIADFYCAEFGIVVEADGAHHTPEQDEYRDRVIASHHLTVLRFSNSEIRDALPTVLAKIKSHFTN